MPKFVVYEVWTRAVVLTAKDVQTAYRLGSPVQTDPDLQLCNWHVVPVVKPKKRRG